MTTDEKLDKISSDLVEVSAMLKMACEVQSRHNSAIYGNGKDGLLTRASLCEDDIEGLSKAHSSVKQKVTDLTKEVNVGLGKMVGVSIGISSIIVVIGFMIKMAGFFK